MHSYQQVKQLVQENIHQIKISEFAAEGGWPNIDDVDVFICHQEEQDNAEIIQLHILYTVSKAACCFIPKEELQMRLPKTVIIKDKNVKIIAS